MIIVLFPFLHAKRIKEERLEKLPLTLSVICFFVLLFSFCCTLGCIIFFLYVFLYSFVSPYQKLQFFFNCDCKQSCCLFIYLLGIY